MIYFIALLFYSSSAFAYVGPGLGVGVVASVLGIFVALIMLLIAVIWYPIKKIIRKIRAKKL